MLSPKASKSLLKRNEIYDFALPVDTSRTQCDLGFSRSTQKVTQPSHTVSIARILRERRSMNGYSIESHLGGLTFASLTIFLLSLKRNLKPIRALHHVREFRKKNWEWLTYHSLHTFYIYLFDMRLHKWEMVLSASYELQYERKRCYPIKWISHEPYLVKSRHSLVF